MVSFGEYAYYVPFFDGKNYGHRVVRVHIEKFNKFDSSARLVGFFSRSCGIFGGFSYKAVDGSTYGYLVHIKRGPVGDGILYL